MIQRNKRTDAYHKASLPKQCFRDPSHPLRKAIKQSNQSGLRISKLMFRAREILAQW